MTKTTTNKKRSTAVLSIILVAVIILGATLAYLFSKTDPVENVFTFADNIKAELDEPNWDPDEALNLTPDKTLLKDPQITNTSENGIVEYAAIKLTWLDGAGNLIDDEELRDLDGNEDTANGMKDMDRLLSLIDIEWSSNWSIKDGTAKSNEQVHVYNKELPQGVTSDPIFYSITIKRDITPEQLEWLAGKYGHEDSCYQSGAHADYMHDITCPVRGDDEEADTAKGGTTTDGNTCDCEPAACTPYYWHHEKCKIAGESDAEDVAKGGLAGNGERCDCEAVYVHTAGCLSTIKTLPSPLTCGHTTIQSGLGNFTIKVEGAVVQADAFADLDAAVADLISLFTATP